MYFLWLSECFLLLCLLVDCASATCFAYEAEVKMTRVGEKLVAYPTQTEPIYNASLRNQLRQFCPKLDDKLQGTTCCGETMLANMNTRLLAIQTWIRDCSACFQSFAQLLCSITCDVNQDIYMELFRTGAVLNPLPGRPTEYIQAAKVSIKRMWLRAHIRECLIYGVLNVSGQSLMDDACVTQECSAMVWLRNVVEYIKNKDLPFHLIFDEVLDQNSESYDAPMKFKTCPEHQIRPSKKDTVVSPPDYRSYPHGSLIFYAYIYGVLLLMFLLAIYYPEDDHATLYRDPTARHPSRFEMLGFRYQRCVRRHFMVVGTAFSSNAWSVISMVLCCVLMLCFCCSYYKQLHVHDYEKWSAAKSRVSLEREYVNANFRLIKSQQNIYLRALNESMWFGNSDHKTMWDEVAKLARNIELLRTPFNLTYNNICRKLPVYDKCLIFHYQLYGQFGDYPKDQANIRMCMHNPEIPECIPSHGHPMDKYIVASGFRANDTVFDTFKITMVNAPLFSNSPMKTMRKEWEAELEHYLSDMKTILAEKHIFLTYMTRHNTDYITSSPPVAINVYWSAFACGVAHLVYLSLVLRHGRQPRILLALSIVAINVLSILSACGILSLFGYNAPDNMLDVMPTIVMSVGADNMAVLVIWLHNSHPKLVDSRNYGLYIGRTLCQVGPSVRVHAFSAILCSFLAALSTNDYASAMAIYMAVALLINWLLQETCFVAILALELRKLANPCDPSYAVPRDDDAPELMATVPSSVLDSFVRNRFIPLMRHKLYKVVVVVAGLSCICVQLNVHFFVTTGEDMTRHLPQNSTIREYRQFDYEVNPLGPPIYFVISGGIDFSVKLNRIIIDNEYEWSIPNQIRRAGIFSRNNYIHATQVDSWWNDFQGWLKTPECCRRSKTDNKFCQPGQNSSDCYFCEMLIDSNKKSATKQFYTHLPLFLLTQPTVECPYGGIGKYTGKLTGLHEKRVDYVIKGYHTVLRTTEEHIRAVRSARLLCQNMTLMARQYLGKLGLISPQEIGKFNIFPYSPMYTFYDQYLEIWHFTLRMVAAALAIVFVVHLAAGLNWVISILVVLAVSGATVNIFGFMYIWSVSATSLTISFVLICIGILPRFVTMFLDIYVQSMQKLRDDRQANAMVMVAKPLVFGVIGNSVFWMIPLAFADPVYLRLYMVMWCSGILFGIFYMPTLIYFLNPRPNKATSALFRKQAHATQRLSLSRRLSPGDLSRRLSPADIQHKGLRPYASGESM